MWVGIIQSLWVQTQQKCRKIANFDLFLSCVVHLLLPTSIGAPAFRLWDSEKLPHPHTFLHPLLRPFMWTGSEVMGSQTFRVGLNYASEFLALASHGRLWDFLIFLTI